MSLPYQDSNSSPSEHDAASANKFLVSQAVTVATAAVLLLGGWLIFVKFAVIPTLGFSTNKKDAAPAKNETTQPPAKSKPVAKKAEKPLAAPQTAPVNTVEVSRAYNREEQQVLLQLQKAEFESRTAQLKSVLDHVDQQHQAWDRRVRSLMESNEGKRLAVLAKQFRFLLSQVPLTKTELERFHLTITNVREAISQAPTPLTDLAPYDKQLESVETRLRTVEAGFEALNAAVDELIELSKPMPDAKTLAEAIAALDSDAAESVLQTASEKKKELQTQFAKEIATADQKVESLGKQLSQAQSDFQQFESETEKRLADAAKKRDEQLRDLAQQRLAARKRMEVALPAFRTRLSPFISPGYRQPESRYKFIVVIEPQPISYSALVRVGALDDDVNGLETLLIMGDSDSTQLWNDRPFGAFPNYVNWEFDGKNPEIVRQLKAVQEFLRLHGEALVEAKLLAP